MTATEVNGVQVIGHKDLYTGIGKKYHRVVELLLADGTSIAGCTTDGCVHTDQSPQSVAYHSKVVHDGWIPANTQKRLGLEAAAAFLAEHPAIVRLAQVTLGDLIERLDDDNSDLEILTQRIAARDKEIVSLTAVNTALRTDVKELRGQMKEYEKVFTLFGKLAPKADAK